MRRAWKLERIRPGDAKIVIRNRHREPIAGWRIKYTPKHSRKAIEKKLEGADLEPERRRIALGKHKDPLVIGGLERIVAGDQVDLSEGGQLVQARSAGSRFSPVHLFRSAMLLWRVRAAYQAPGSSWALRCWQRLEGPPRAWGLERPRPGDSSLLLRRLGPPEPEDPAAEVGIVYRRPGPAPGGRELRLDISVERLRGQRHVEIDLPPASGKRSADLLLADEAFWAEVGDTIEIYDDRDHLEKAMFVGNRWHPLHLLDGLLWHSQTWLGEWMKRLWSRFQATGIWARASSMAYDTVLVVVPFAILLLILFARLDQGGSQDLERTIVSAMSRNGEDPELTGRVATFLEQLHDARLGFGMYLFGLLSTVLFMMQVGDHLNEMRGSPLPPRSWWRTVLKNVLVFPGVVAASYVGLQGIVVASGWVAGAEWIEETVGFALYPAASGVLLWAVLFLTYYFVPSVRPRARSTAVAALIAAIATVVAFSSTAYLTRTERLDLFGPLRFVPAALVGCYFGWLIFFLGAFWAYSDRDLPRGDPTIGSVHVRLGILLALEKGGSRTIYELGEDLGLDPALVWREALAMQSNGSEGLGPVPIRVGTCSMKLEPRVWLETAAEGRTDPSPPGGGGGSSASELETAAEGRVRAALGDPDLLLSLHGERKLADDLGRRLTRIGSVWRDGKN